MCIVEDGEATVMSGGRSNKSWIKGAQDFSSWNVREGTASICGHPRDSQLPLGGGPFPSTPSRPGWSGECWLPSSVLFLPSGTGLELERLLTLINHFQAINRVSDLSNHSEQLQSPSGKGLSWADLCECWKEAPPVFPSSLEDHVHLPEKYTSQKGYVSESLGLCLIMPVVGGTHF